MTDRILLPQYLNAFREYLLREEKSAVTIEKYLRDAHTFLVYVGEQMILCEGGYDRKRYLYLSSCI